MKAGTCIHYQGGPNSTCAVGVDIRKHVGGPDFGWGCRKPCIRREISGVPASEKVPCDKYQEPTAEQVAECEAEFERAIQRVQLVFPAIKKHANGKRGVNGSIECPACKTGTLHYSIAGLNGHVRAACTTKDCVNVIQ